MSQKYGVKMTLQENSPLSAEHLLGEQFAAERWFDTKEERSEFLKSYKTPFIYYRRSDSTTLNYKLLEK